MASQSTLELGDMVFFLLSFLVKGLKTERENHLIKQTKKLPFLLLLLKRVQLAMLSEKVLHRDCSHASISGRGGWLEPTTWESIATRAGPSQRKVNASHVDEHP